MLAELDAYVLVDRNGVRVRSIADYVTLGRSCFAEGGIVVKISHPQLFGIRYNQLTPGNLIVTVWRDHPRYCLYTMTGDGADADPGIVILNPLDDDGVNVDVVDSGSAANFGSNWKIEFDCEPDAFYFRGPVELERPGSILLGEAGPVALVLHTVMGRRSYYDLETGRATRERPDFKAGVMRWRVLSEGKELCDVTAMGPHQPR